MQDQGAVAGQVLVRALLQVADSQLLILSRHGRFSVDQPSFLWLLKSSVQE